MISVVAFASIVLLGAPGDLPRCTDETGGRVDGELRALWEGGADYDAFLDAAEHRRALWVSNTERAGVPDDLLARARAVGGTWYLLAVAVDGCSDSVSTIPYMARLASMVDGLELRIVDSTVGRRIMMEHPTRDDRAATPTVLLLDAGWNEMGCFIERPDALQDWYQENKAELGSEELFERKMAWYDEDAGLSTVRELVEMLEGAAERTPVCRG